MQRVYATRLQARSVGVHRAVLQGHSHRSRTYSFQRSRLAYLLKLPEIAGLPSLRKVTLMEGAGRSLVHVFSRLQRKYDEEIGKRF